ncbi:hypothetical protein [Pectobacterium versatile]|nr:hypothetical protein [Pectobacterium versatile]
MTSALDRHQTCCTAAYLEFNGDSLMSNVAHHLQLAFASAALTDRR